MPRQGPAATLVQVGQPTRRRPKVPIAIWQQAQALASMSLRSQSLPTGLAPARSDAGAAQFAERRIDYHHRFEAESRQERELAPGANGPDAEGPPALPPAGPVMEPIDMQAKVQDVMSFPVHVITADTYFKDIAAQVQRHRVSALPVVDADRRLIGIVSEADLILKEEEGFTEKTNFFESRGRRQQRSKALGLTARQLMTSPVVTVGPDTSIARAARLMRERRVKRLPVVDKDGLVLGIVSRADLLKLFLRDDDQIRREISELISRTWPGSTGVEITVRAGMVVLRGVVQRRSDVELLSDLTKRTDGVVDVQNLLAFRIDDNAPRTDLPQPWPLYGVISRPHLD